MFVQFTALTLTDESNRVGKLTVHLVRKDGAVLGVIQKRRFIPYNPDVAVNALEMSDLASIAGFIKSCSSK